MPTNAERQRNYRKRQMARNKEVLELIEEIIDRQNQAGHFPHRPQLLRIRELMERK